MKIKHLLTKEGKELKGNEYDLYPRPQLRRESFFSLNGEWDFTFGEDKTKNRYFSCECTKRKFEIPD